MTEEENGTTEEEGQKAKDGPPRVGVFVCDCGLNIAGSVNTQAVADYAATLPDVVWAGRQKYTCSDPGQLTIEDMIAEHDLNR
ncbi:MAG: disulfide reductase, partial [Thermoplasmata archaeon]|nr:disulfide reductase [Thermoplasmata archaeon]